MIKWNILCLVFVGFRFLSVNGNCGGDFTGDVGAFAVATGPNIATPDSCIVKINVTEGKLAVIRFKTLTLEQDSFCTKDFIEVRDGFYETSPLIRRYCDRTTFTVAATQNFLFLRFINGGSTDDVVVSAEFSTFDPNDVYLNRSSGSFASARFQGPGTLVYPNNLRTTITVSVPGDFGIIVTFSEFTLEPSDGGKCLDYVEIRQSDGTPLGTYCGDKLPVDVVSRSNVVHMYFVTNTYFTYPGFSFNWEVCGGLLELTTGTLALPRINGYYRNNMDCRYIFRQPVGKRVAVTFAQFKLQAPNSIGKCFDYVQIIDTGHGGFNPLGEHCGEKAAFTITSTTNELTVRFSSDSKDIAYGFDISYRQIDECGGKFNQFEGQIKSATYYSNLYSGNDNCQYHIRTLPGSKLMVGFQKFNLEEKRNSDCLDYVEVIDPLAFIHITQPNGLIHDHNLDTSHVYYCGTKTPPTRIYYGNELDVRFVTDGSYEGQGFIMDWAACGGLVSGHYGEIKSPNLYAAYTFDIECVYVLQSTEVEQYYIEYTSSVGTNVVNCENALQISEIGIQNKSLLSLPCSSKSSGLILSSSKQIQIKFNQRIGRQRAMKYSVKWTACGSRVTSPTGYIRSPFWPGYYPIKRTCTYTIDSLSGSNVVLDFPNLDLYKTDICEDYIQIHNGDSELSPIIRVITGKTKPETTVSTTSRMFVKFVAQCDISSTGFQAKWSVCGVTLNDESGEILSPSYPDKYIRDIACSYSITQYPGKITSLTFKDFQVGSSLNGACVDDYVEIRDGFIRQSTLIGQFCGELAPFTVNSSSNTIVLILVSTKNPSLNFRGFKATYVSAVKDIMVESTTQPLQPNYTVIYSGLSWDQENLLNLDVALISTLSVIVVILIVVIVVLLVLNRRKKPPLIIPEQKVVVPAKSDNILNYRENTQLLDVYNKVPTSSPNSTAQNQMTLQQQLREQQRRKSTGSHVPRDIYAHPHKRNIPESIHENIELNRNKDAYKQTADNYAQMTESYTDEGVELDNYARVDKRNMKPPAVPRKGYINDTYDDVENTRPKHSQDMMYL